MDVRLSPMLFLDVPVRHVHVPDFGVVVLVAVSGKQVRQFSPRWREHPYHLLVGPVRLTQVRCVTRFQPLPPPFTLLRASLGESGGTWQTRRT